MEFSTRVERVVRFIAAGRELLARSPRPRQHLRPTTSALIMFPTTFALIMFSWAAPAQADPCEGPLPSAAGQKFEGLVRYVGDGDSLCVGQAADPGTWIEVRLADFDAPELHAPEGRRAVEQRRYLSKSRSATERDARPVLGAADASSLTIGNRSVSCGRAKYRGPAKRT